MLVPPFRHQHAPSKPSPGSGWRGVSLRDGPILSGAITRSARTVPEPQQEEKPQRRALPQREFQQDQHRAGHHHEKSGVDSMIPKGKPTATFCLQVKDKKEFG